jgi:hypothetical protein
MLKIVRNPRALAPGGFNTNTHVLRRGILRARSAENADSMMNPLKTGEESLSNGTI